MSTVKKVFGTAPGEQGTMEVDEPMTDDVENSGSGDNNDANSSSSSKAPLAPLKRPAQGDSSSGTAEAKGAEAPKRKKRKKKKKKKNNQDEAFKSSCHTTTTSSRTRRPRRSAARRAANDMGLSFAIGTPDVSHYVGYVEEGETVDMIMKKFEALEEVKRASAAAACAAKSKETKAGCKKVDGDGKGEAGEDASSSSSPVTEGGASVGDDGSLTAEQLQELFKRTSNFTVNSVANERRNAERLAERMDRVNALAIAGDIEGALAAQDAVGWQNAASLLADDMDNMGGHGYCGDCEDDVLFWDGSQDEDDFWDQIYMESKGRRGKRKKVPRRRSSTSSKTRRRSRLAGESGRPRGVTTVAFVSDRHGRYVTALKRIRKVDPDAVTYVKVPRLSKKLRVRCNEGCLVPRSWAKPISRGGSLVLLRDLTKPAGQASRSPNRLRRRKLEVALGAEQWPSVGLRSFYSRVIEKKEQQSKKGANKTKAGNGAEKKKKGRKGKTRQAEEELREIVDAVQGGEMQIDRSRDERYQMSTDLTTFDYLSLVTGPNGGPESLCDGGGADDGKAFTFQGIVLDIPWHLPNEEEGEGGGKEGEEEGKDGREERATPCRKVHPSDLTCPQKTLHQLGDPRLLRNGFIFVWVDKSIIAEVLLQFEQLGFFYVENACWVMERVNNTHVRLPSTSGLFRNTHETLLILRKAKKASASKRNYSNDNKEEHGHGFMMSGGSPVFEKIEIKHQRTEDVAFSYLRCTKKDVMSKDDEVLSRRCPPHEWVWRMAETLLPYSVPTRNTPAALTKTEQARLMKGKENEEKEGAEEGKEAEKEVKQKYQGRGRLLEVWGQPGRRRKGWTMLVQGKKN